MTMPKINLKNWFMEGSNGSVLVFKSLSNKNEFRLLPVAIVFDGDGDKEGQIVRARSYVKENHVNISDLFA